MIIRGFIDESYSGDQNNGLFTLACLFVRPETLAWFELAWQRAIDKVNEKLTKQGRPPIERFHAAYLNGGKGEFKDWSREERIEFAKDLIKVIRNHKSSHTALTVELGDLKAVWPEIEDDALPSAYNMMMKFFMWDIGEIFEQEKMGERVDFVVERGPGVEPILTAYEQLTADRNFHFRGRFDSIRVGNWESDVLLQVADLFSYEAYKDAVRRGKEVEDPRLSMTALLELDSVGIRTRHLTREALMEIKRMQEENTATKAPTGY
jgi:Protein of unknown function (DUF3800)